MYLLQLRSVSESHSFEMQSSGRTGPGSQSLWQDRIKLWELPVANKAGRLAFALTSLFDLRGSRVEPQKNWNLFINNCVFITCLNLSPSKYSLHLMQYTYQDVFSTAQNSLWTRWFWCLLVLLLFFVSPRPHQQNISLWGRFSIREIKESHSEWDQVNREGGAWGSRCFWSKAAEHSVQCGQVYL